MRPLYFLIAILLGVNYVFVNFRIGPLTFDRLLEFLLFFIFLKDFLQEWKNNPFFKGWVNFIVGFGLLQIVVNLRMVMLGALPLMDVFSYFFKSLSFLVFSYLFYLILRKGRKYVDVLLFVHLLIVVFSLLLHPLSPISAKLFEYKALLFPVLDDELMLRLGTEREYITGGYSTRYRVSGPFATAILFSYFAISSFLLNFYMFIKHKGKFYLFNLILILVASVLCQTRSLVLGELLIIGGYIFFLPGPKRKFVQLKLIIAGLFGIAFIYGYKLTKNEYAQISTSDTSRLTSVSSSGESDSRPLLWYTGLYTAIVNPLGISSENYWDVKWEFYFQYGHPHILMFPSHNGLINIAFQYSFFGYILFAFFVWFLLRYIKQLPYKFRLYFIMALLGYAFHVFFHNDFILDDDYLFLLILVSIGYEWSRVEIPEKEPKTSTLILSDG